MAQDEQKPPWGQGSQGQSTPSSLQPDPPSQIGQEPQVPSNTPLASNPVPQTPQPSGLDIGQPSTGTQASDSPPVTLSPESPTIPGQGAENPVMQGTTLPGEQAQGANTPPAGEGIKDQKPYAPQPQTIPPPPLAKPSLFKKPLFVVLIAVIVVVIAAAVFFYLNAS